MSEINVSTQPVVVPVTKPVVPEKVGNGGDLASKVKQFHDDALREIQFKH